MQEICFVAGLDLAIVLFTLVLLWHVCECVQVWKRWLRIKPCLFELCCGTEISQILNSLCG